MRPEADEDAVREVAEPLLVEVEHVEGVRTVRVQRPPTEREPAHRVLTLVGTPIHLAALRGRLHRSGDSDDCDFMVGDTRVRLLPEHQIGPLGSALVLDGAANQFADQGDEVCCVGGFVPSGPVRGTIPIFNAGQLRVYE